MRRVYASIVIRRVTKKNERRELVANGNGLRSFRLLVSRTLCNLCSTCIFRGLKGRKREEKRKGERRKSRRRASPTSGDQSSKDFYQNDSASRGVEAVNKHLDVIIGFRSVL